MNRIGILSDAKNLYVVNDRIAIKDYTRECVNYWLSRGVVPMLEKVAEDLFDSDEFTLCSYSESKELVSDDQLEMISVYDFAKNVQNLVSFNMPDDEEDFYEKRTKNMKLMIKENYDHESTYYVESYYDGDFRGLEDDFNTNDFSEAVDWIWEKLNSGGFVWITDNVSGQNAKLALPDDSEYYDYIDPNDCIIWSSKYGENIDLNTNLHDLLECLEESKRCKHKVCEKISEKDYSNSITGKAYKVFRVKNGKLYPPMVANSGGADTPIGVWLDAEEGEFAGLSKTGRKQVKSIGSGSLAYRPGWHLGDEPRASQFDRSVSWIAVDDSVSVDKTVSTLKSFISSFAKASNIGKVAYVKELNQNFEVIGGNVYFPYDFIWAECEYVMDINYQAEADEQGYMRTRDDGTEYRSDKYQHSLAGLPKLPKDGYYKYRTNPRPDTVPWVITGAMKVTKLLDDFDVKQICPDAPDRQGGNKTLEELGF